MPDSVPRFTGADNTVWQVNRPAYNTQQPLGLRDRAIGVGVRAAAYFLPRPTLFGQHIVATQTREGAGVIARIHAYHDRASLREPQLTGHGSLRPFHLQITPGGDGRMGWSSNLGNLAHRHANDIVDGFLALDLEHLIKDGPKPEAQTALWRYRKLKQNLEALAEAHDRRPLDGTSYVFNIGGGMAGVLRGLDSSAQQEHFAAAAPLEDPSSEILEFSVRDYSKNPFSAVVAKLSATYASGHASLCAPECYGQFVNGSWVPSTHMYGSETQKALLDMTTTLTQDALAAGTVPLRPLQSEMHDRMIHGDPIAAMVPTLPEVELSLAPVGVW